MDHSSQRLPGKTSLSALRHVSACKERACILPQKRQGINTNHGVDGEVRQPGGNPPCGTRRFPCVVLLCQLIRGRSECIVMDLRRSVIADWWASKVGRWRSIDGWNGQWANMRHRVGYKSVLSTILLSQSLKGIVLYVDPAMPLAERSRVYNGPFRWRKSLVFTLFEYWNEDNWVLSVLTSTSSHTFFSALGLHLQRTLFLPFERPFIAHQTRHPTDVAPYALAAVHHTGLLRALIAAADIYPVHWRRRRGHLQVQVRRDGG